MIDQIDGIHQRRCVEQRGLTPPAKCFRPFGPYDKRLYSQDTQKVQDKSDILNVSSTEKDE